MALYGASTEHLKLEPTTIGTKLPQETMTDSTLIIREADVLERQATHLIGTLGHVSEGKSTLIRALTGIKTQRHVKEQERNITIHLGYANCKIYQNNTTGDFAAVKTTEGPPAAGSWTLIAHLSWVDCPGHEAFLATMLGGASIMDTACMIIAANQEVIPQPQTQEHLIAATMMGLERAVVVQNKLDLLKPSEAVENYDKIRGFLTETILEEKPLFPISAQHGWGVGEVLDTIVRLGAPVRDLEAPALLSCVRSFDVNKPGPIVVGGEPLKGAVIGGTLQQGVLAVGDWIEIRPGILKRGAHGIAAQPVLTRVRGLRCESTELPVAVPGSLIAIATDLDPGLSIANGMVGQRVGVPGTLPPLASVLTLRIHKLKRDTFAFHKHKVGDKVRICSNVMTTEGTLTSIDEKKRFTVRLDRPLCIGLGERVGILRRHTEAGRELIEGYGEVRGLEPWAEVEEPLGFTEAAAEIAAQKTRKITWIPQERPEFEERPVRPYTELLDAVMACGAAGAGPSRFKLKDVVVEQHNKQTVWVNWTEVVGGFGASEIPYAEHLLEYLQAELATTANLTGSNQLFIKGRYRAEDVRALVRKYLTAYKRCGQCQGYDTSLVKAGRVLKIRCARCQTDSLADA